MRTAIYIFDQSENNVTHYILNLLGSYAIFSFLCLHFIKVCRMIYVIKCDKPSPWVRNILKSEGKLIAIGLSSSFLPTLTICLISIV